MNALVRVNGRSAQTTLELSVHNGGNVPTEAELVLPVPEGVVVKGFYYGDGKASWQASLMPADEARRLYDRIVARRLDPALLEFAGFGAHSLQRIPRSRQVFREAGRGVRTVADSGGRTRITCSPGRKLLSGHAAWTMRVEISPELQASAMYSRPPIRWNAIG